MARPALTGPAIVVDEVKKTFVVPQERVHTFKERALHPLRGSQVDRFQALKGISFVVEHGEFFGIVGRNGSGKSTLLKCLAGIYGVDGGTIAKRGRVSTFIELGVGFNPDLAARDNAMLNAIMLGLDKREAETRYEQIIEFAELEEFQDLKIKNYSSGMLVRLAFAVMIQVDADILLIDEVLAVGDASFQQKCFDEFSRLREEKRTVLLVTHDMGAVERYCDRAMVLEKGNALLLGEPKDVATEYFELNFGRGGDGRADGPVGSGKAHIDLVWFETGDRTATAHWRQGEPAKFAAAVTFRERTENPIVGFALEDSEGRVVFATNSRLHHDPLGVFQPGESLNSLISLDAAFAPGKYHLTVTVATLAAGDNFLDKRRRAASVQVIGTRITGGMVDLPHDFAVGHMPATEAEAS